MQKSIPAVIMRGGTSRGIFFKRKNFPCFSDEKKRSEIILSIFGRDSMRIDGLGSIHSHGSKAIIVGTSAERKDIDLEYTYARVSVDKPIVEYKGNCGNLTSAVAPFAIDEGLVESQEPITSLVLYNTNTGKKVISEVPVENRVFKTHGDYSIDGVPGFGAKIVNRFLDPAGSDTGSLLPTGNLVDALALGGRRIRCSIVDAGSSVVFVKAEDIGLTGKELPWELNVNGKTLQEMEKLRKKAGELIGVKSLGVPKIAFVGASQNYTTLSGEEIKVDAIDLVARIISMQKVHHAYAITGAICTAVAAKLEGTVVHELSKAGKEEVIIGHPKGKVEIGVKIKGRNLEEVTLGRTARQLMKGVVYYNAAL